MTAGRVQKIVILVSTHLSPF